MTAALRLAAAVLAAALGCGAWGTPAAEPVEVPVVTPLAGADAATVEREATIPLEHALSGIPGLTRVASRSRGGVSEVIASFAPTTDLFAARQEVRVRLDAADTLAAGVVPELRAPSVGVVLRYEVAAPALSPVELRRLQDERVRPAVARVSGVADVTTCGGREARVEVRVDPARLAALDLELTDVLRAVADADPAAAGPVMLLDLGSAGIEALGPRRVGERDGAPILLRDVAVVASGAAPPTCLAATDVADDAVVGEVWLAAGADAAAVRQAVAERLRSERPALPPDVTVQVFDEVLPGSPEPLSLSLHFGLPPGVSWAEAGDVAHRLREALAAPEVATVLTMVPRRDTIAAVITLRPKAARPAERASVDAVVTGLLQRAARVPELGPARVVPARATRQPEFARWRPVGVRLYGDDADTLATLSAQVTAALRAVDGITSVQVEGAARETALAVHPDGEALARHGVEVAAVVRVLQASAEGIPGGVVREGERRLDVVVTLPTTADDPAALGALRVSAAGGAAVQLSQVARLTAETAPSELLRDRLQRCVLVRVTAPTRSTRQVVEAGGAALVQLPLPTGVRLEWDTELADR